MDHYVTVHSVYTHTCVMRTTFNLGHEEKSQNLSTSKIP